MIYEWRMYDIMPGKAKEIHDQFATHIPRLFKKHAINAIGFWEAEVERNGHLYYMVEYEGLEERQKSWQGFSSDPEWLKIKQDTEKDGPLVSKITK